MRWFHLSLTIAFNWIYQLFSILGSILGWFHHSSVTFSYWNLSPVYTHVDLSSPSKDFTYVPRSGSLCLTPKVVVLVGDGALGGVISPPNPWGGVDFPGSNCFGFTLECGVHGDSVPLALGFATNPRTTGKIHTWHLVTNIHSCVFQIPADPHRIIWLKKD